LKREGTSNRWLRHREGKRLAAIRAVAFRLERLFLFFYCARGLSSICKKPVFCKNEVSLSRRSLPMPVLPFIAGLAVGVAAVKLYRNERFRANLRETGQRLRQSGEIAEGKLRHAAISGLDALSGSSARLRERLEDKAEISLRAETEEAEKKDAQDVKNARRAGGRKKPA
jgi:hypothetical protein